MQKALTILLVSISAMAFSACNNEATNQDKRSNNSSQDTTQVTLQTVGVLKGDVTRVINASGKVIPQEQVLVGSEVSGRVNDVRVDFNSVVKKGDILAEIDDEKFNNTLEQLLGRLKSADADILVQDASINRARVSFCLLYTSPSPRDS